MTNKKRLIIFHPPSHHDIDMFDAPSDGDCVTPWIFVRDKFKEQNIEIVTSYRAMDRLHEAHRVIFMNIPYEIIDWKRKVWDYFQPLRGRKRGIGGPLFEECQRLGLTDKLLAILWEPPVVAPLIYRLKAHEYFHKVLTWSPKLLKQDKRYSRIVMPQYVPLSEPHEIAFPERKLLCNFSGHKFSSHPQELYSAREKMIRFMEKHYPDDFDHYGPGWDATWSSWRGVVPNKFNVYPRYRFGLCYENMQDEAGYLTEKIIDCLAAGTVPVYWGCPEVKDIVPEKCFIDRRQFENERELILHIKSISESEWKVMREIGLNFLRSEAFDSIGPKALFNSLETVIWE